MVFKILGKVLSLPSRCFIVETMSKVTRFFLSIFLIFCFISPADARVVYHKKSVHSVNKTTKNDYFSAKSAMLWNITEDKVYFSKNINDRIYPASTTKVMTVLLALEKLSLDQYVTVSVSATQVAPTRLNFLPGEQYLVSDLIYACLLKSANDAAVVLAEAVAGSEGQFVVMMNQKAESMGAVNTRFANAHGLPSKNKQYTTAYDMAVIFKEAFKNPFFQKAITFPYKIIYSKKGRKHFLKSHNKALFLNWKQNVYGKTGYTLQAQSCFIGYFKKGDEVFIVDVFGCRTRKRWEDIKWLIEHFTGVDL